MTTNVTGHHVTRGNTNTSLKAQAHKLLTQLAGGGEGVAGGVGKRDWRTKNSQRSIALELVNNALVAVHNLHHMLKETIELLHNLFWIMVDSERGRTNHVNEHNGNLTILAA